MLESLVEQVFYIEDERNENWEFVLKAQPRDLYNMRSRDPDKQAIDVDAYQQVELENDVEGEHHDSSHDDFSVTFSLATNLFVEHKGSKEVQMVKNLIEDEGFINGELKFLENQVKLKKNLILNRLLDNVYLVYTIKAKMMQQIKMFVLGDSNPAELEPNDHASEGLITSPNKGMLLYIYLQHIFLLIMCSL